MTKKNLIFSGKTDKNGVRIIEGDILSYEWSHGERDEFVVELMGGEWSFLDGYEENEWEEADRGSEWEVVGNIHNSDVAAEDTIWPCEKCGAANE